MVLLIAAAVLLFVLAQRGQLGPLVWEGRTPGPLLQGHGAEAHAVESAEGVLARRLADGEITPDEYLERASLLRDR